MVPPRGVRFDEHARAFWLPIVGVGAVLILACAPVAKEITGIAVTAIVTLTAGAAGHAAGMAASHREELKQSTKFAETETASLEVDE